MSTAPGNPNDPMLPAPQRRRGMLLLIGQVALVVCLACLLVIFYRYMVAE